MSPFFNNIVHVFEYFDRPILFVSKVHKNLFLLNLIEDKYEYEKWIISPLSSSEYSSLLDSDLDFYSCFNQNKAILKLLHNKAGKVREESISAIDLGLIEEYFPKPGLVARELISSNGFQIYNQPNK